uniref:Putative secreted protein n=1 Tax=Ixodes ricinus TaxID=34613 RepID=A0A6B0UEN3_IXORI
MTKLRSACPPFKALSLAPLLRIALLARSIVGGLQGRSYETIRSLSYTGGTFSHLSETCKGLWKYVCSRSILPLPPQVFTIHGVDQLKGVGLTLRPDTGR